MLKLTRTISIWKILQHITDSGKYLPSFLEKLGFELGLLNDTLVCYDKGWLVIEYRLSHKKIPEATLFLCARFPWKDGQFGLSVGKNYHKSDEIDKLWESGSINSDGIVLWLLTEYLSIATCLLIEDWNKGNNVVAGIMPILYQDITPLAKKYRAEIKYSYQGDSCTFVINNDKNLHIQIQLNSYENFSYASVRVGDNFKDWRGALKPESLNGIADFVDTTLEEFGL